MTRYDYKYCFVVCESRYQITLCYRLDLHPTRQMIGFGCKKKKQTEHQNRI